ncbi:unnamed protein product [Sphenostylis stenocarpa]|uniref:Uncharacterized protein n=1 Tax=Sphenostylis stenocarpa TaxID=92480 RepID=A0AA86SQL2_9FABA|nr:unnamed protein product [Sphenostylis stenocarpa]
MEARAEDQITGTKVLLLPSLCLAHQHPDKAMACPLLRVRNTRAHSREHCEMVRVEHRHSIPWHCSLCPCLCGTNTVNFKIAKISVL